MKKVLLTAMALLTIASASAFGMYGDRDSWIDFLVHGNQFRARMDQLGFVLGNGTIKGTFGFRSQALTTALGNILTTGASGNVDLTTTISAGIGYTSEPFGIGLGYNYTHVHDRLGVHTPVLMINALNNNLRIAIPIQIAVSGDPNNNAQYYPNYNSQGDKDYLGISTDVQIRYYTGIDAFNAIRVYFKYGQASYKNDEGFGTTEYNAQSVGFETRFYFLNTPVGNVTINPYLKVAFNTSLQGYADNNQVRAGGAGDGSIRGFNSSYSYNGYSSKYEWEKSPYDVTVAAVLGITANSDIVSLYVEPSLGYKATYNGKYKMDINGSTTTTDSGKVLHNLSWGAYTELYIRPTQDLEWYFEMDVNNSGTKQSYTIPGTDTKIGSGVPVYFEATTGITWYLPAFN
ncbi:variable surface family protein [Brachyspira hampsonii]|uniref:variable surface family protein n=1 Tax=Brachyspira hampsonii TaxID=1287055 RepID=UPI000D33FE52|nr:variable surface family protein [Brachyspira hampsonii]PTY41449.1 cell surface protein [Brachyspira hampsonii bv. II]